MSRAKTHYESPGIQVATHNNYINQHHSADETLSLEKGKVCLGVAL